MPAYEGTYIDLRMNPSLLRTFLTVARCQTAARAASELHRAQSSVSDQIQALEYDLGTSLFLRSKQGFRLTSAGEVLMPHAHRILAAIDEAHAAVAIANSSIERSLTIGALETIAAEVLPKLVASLRLDHPDLRVRIEVAGSDVLLQRVRDGSNDVAFCFRNGATDDRLARQEFAREPLVLIGPPVTGHDSKIRLDWNTPAAMLFIATEPGCVYRHLFEEAWRQDGRTQPKLSAEVSSIGAIVSLVAAGSGFALVPQMAARAKLDRGAVVALDWPGSKLEATLDMIWRRRRVQPPGLTQLLALIRGARRVLK